MRLYASPYPISGREAPRAPRSRRADGSYSFTVHSGPRTRATGSLVPGTRATRAGPGGRDRTRDRQGPARVPLGRALVTIVVFHPRDLRLGRRARALVVRERRPRARSQPPPRRERSPAQPVRRGAAHRRSRCPPGRFASAHASTPPGARRAARPRARPPAAVGCGYRGGGAPAGRLPVARRAIARAARVPGRPHRPHRVRGRRHRRPPVRRARPLDVHRPASVVKAMLLVAYLRQLDAMRPALRSTRTATRSSIR